MEKIPSWMERLLLPKLNEISGELKAIHTRIDAVATGIVSLRNETKTEIVSLRNEMLAKFEAADTRVASLRTELKSDFASFKTETKFESLDARIPAIEKLTEFEARVLEVEKKLAEV